MILYKSFSGLFSAGVGIAVLLFLQVQYSYAEVEKTITPFEDKTLKEKIVLPDWFKLSFLDLQDDLTEALDANKQGLIVYFGQKECPYCKAMLDNSWSEPYIAAYVQKHFDVVAIDTKGQRTVTDIDGQVYDEKEFAITKKTNFTPSLIFYDKSETQVLKLTGYHSPYRFAAALEYVADNHYKKTSFSDYMAQADLGDNPGKGELNKHDSFDRPPLVLDRTHIKTDEPIMVLFERPQCYACDVLHANPLQDKNVIKKLEEIQTVQLNIQSDVPVITPAGNKKLSSEWAKELGLFYTPTMIFFDGEGKEIIRINSIVWVRRLSGVLDYVLTKAYKTYPTFQAWRQRNLEIENMKNKVKK